MGPDRTAVYRAAAEAGLAASLVLFLYTFLRIGLWHVWIRTVFWVWIAAQFALIVVAIIDPPTASGLARSSTILIAGVGTGLIAYFALRGQDRALSLIPSWMLLIVWLLGASMIVLGKLSGEVVVSGLVSGLVLIIVLLGFTVTQFAFRTGGGTVSLGPPSLVQMKSLAVDGSGSAKAPGRRGERTYEGERVLTFESPAGVIVAKQTGDWIGIFNGDKPVITWDPALTWQWPLEVGKSWTGEQRMTIHAAKATVPYSVTQKVEAYEDVTVPAGTFKTFKVSTVTSLGDENLLWFSPELGIFVKQSLKRTAKHRQGTGTREIELLSYKRGG